MTTTPRSQFHHSQLLLLLLGAILLVIHAATAEKQKQAMTRPACPGMCGNISIPFPFGIGPGCFRDGFEVLCKQSSSSDLPRAFLAAANTTMAMGYSNDSPSRVYTREEQIELVSISVATAEARAYAAVSYLCATDGTGSSLSTENALHLASTLFAVSANSNVFIGLGWKADAQLSYYSPSELFFSCRALDNEFNSTWADKPGNGTCTGGCCQAPVERLGNNLSWSVKFLFTQKNEYWETHPCSYSMLVEKSGYSYSLPDISGNMRVPQRFPRGTPFVLDFVAGDASCPAEGRPPPRDYACFSGNSSCANATYTTHARYVCKCWPGYDGNPYMPDGCQDIDECTAPQNPCTNGGDCQNKVGGYDCPCKPGMRDDGKGGSCTLVFPLAARAAVGAIGGILLMVITLFLFILHKEKKKTKEFYKRNGGPILEKADVIKLFKKGELKPIIRSSNLIGKGCFGEVYKGLLHDKLVAIKKPINGTVLESEQFANEVIIQSRVIHKNIVRLIGCCLEVDAPMLVYEFISQGSLHDILHNINYKVPLNLSTRLSIAAQSADGLAYMHSKANITILHGDVKPENILLNDNFEPKVADFGISRLIQRDKEHTGAVIGDMNYMDPVYLQEGLLTEKSDVYSFGIVILELISRRRAIHSERNSLVKGFVEVHKKHKTATEFFDKEIALKENLDLLDSLAGMAVECLSHDVDQRPTMMEVAERLLILGRSRKV